MKETLIQLSPEIEARGEAKVNLGGREFTIKQQLLDDLEEHTLRDEIKNLGHAQRS